MNINKQPARVRFAPSPTGHLHLGGARTALYDYLLAKQSGGQFIVRIEDTDQKRLVPGAENEMLDSLRWLGLQWDEGPDIGGPYAPYRQSERKELYQAHARRLIERGHAYYCFCSSERLAEVRREQQARKENPHYDGTCRNISLEEADRRVFSGEPHVIRFKMPKEGSTTVIDQVRGEITVENALLDDTILVKSDGLAVYHLAAMVDDYHMKISHVIRGSEWLPTFPLHSLIYRAFGWQEPQWVHLSVFLKPSGSGKMSKRDVAELGKDGYSIFIKDMKHLGYLPEAVVNWIALMGWSYDDHTEFFSLYDLVQKFSLEKLNPSPAAINFTKFDHFNGLHIRSLNAAELANRIKPFFNDAGIQAGNKILEKIAPIIQERLVTLDEATSRADFFFDEDVQPLPKELVAKGLDAKESAHIARRSFEILTALPEISPQTAEAPMRAYVEESGLKPAQVFGILRVAVTGRAVSPPLFESMEIIGKEKVLQRLKDAIKILEEMAANEEN